jgi:hypothetical protein
MHSMARAKSCFTCLEQKVCFAFVPVLEKKKIQFTIQNIHRVESLWIEEERNIDRKPPGIIG